MKSYSERDHQESIISRLSKRNDGYAPFKLSGEETIAELFDIQVARHPLKVAITSEGDSISYNELARRSRRIASALERKMLARNESVALLIKDQKTLVASMLGVVRAGGCYVPIDPSFAEERNALLLKASQARIVITERSLLKIAERSRAEERQIIIVLDEVEGEHDDVTDNSTPEDRACIMFTSGVAGRAKGVLQSQRSLLQSVKRYSDSLWLGSSDRVSLLSSCPVTASAETILGTLLNGGTLCGCTVPDSGLDQLADWIDSEKITIYQSVPSLFRDLTTKIPKKRVFPTTQIVSLGGSSLYKKDWDLFKSHFTQECILVNFYGCSEIRTVSRFYMDTKSQLVEGVLPVGYPLEGVAISVVSDNGEEHRVVPSYGNDGSVPIDGEIVVSSKYLALGYCNDLANAEAIGSLAPKEDGVRVYRTGDMGQLRADQGLVHMGREDFQIKTSGFRVETAEA